MILIDGSQGEGGGQIVRTAVGLAAALGKAVRITAIRAGRPKPGLRAQHLAAVRAAATVCGGTLQGDRSGSTELTFQPGPVRPGRYAFDVGTAGSTVLVLQTVLPALMLAEGDSELTVRGGTHNPMAPCFEYLGDVFAVLASAMNLQAYFEMRRAGFYPAGGGEVTMHLRGVGGAEGVAPLRLASRGALRGIEGLSAVSASLSAHIAERQARAAERPLRRLGCPTTVTQAAWQSDSPGTAVFLRAVFARSVAGFSALGERGKPAERVAKEAVEALEAFLASPGAVDAHAADQLVALAALSDEPSRFIAQSVTHHLGTNLQVVRAMTGREARADEATGEVVVE